MALKRLNISQKKIRKHPKANPDAVEEFLLSKQQYERTGRPIVYIDESGFKSQSYRPYAYAPRGQKCMGQYNWHLKNTTNAIGALYQNRLIAVGLYDFSINADVFHSWVKSVLLPELPPNSVLVMDNAAFHKRQDIQELIIQEGHTILWLPPYCPFLNLIEHTWAWIKHLR
ncbi:IS630 family transposase [Ursidibacter arcticus]